MYRPHIFVIPAKAGTYTRWFSGGEQTANSKLMGPGFRRDDGLDYKRGSMPGYVYILASRRYGTLYTGVTSNLGQRITQHREGLIPGFTRQYGVTRLVYIETFDDIRDAIIREKRIKEWKRDWKIELIERNNPLWDDLAVPMFGLPLMPAREPRPTTAKGMGPGFRRDDDVS